MRLGKLGKYVRFRYSDIATLAYREEKRPLCTDDPVLAAKVNSE
jgi:hypothetical protein